MWVYKDNELQHHGVKGQKWGVRRYQTKNGKLTSAGKKRYLLGFGAKKKEDPKAAAAKGKASSSSKKSFKDMSDDELKKAIERLKLEEDYKQRYDKLNPQKISKGKQFIDKSVIPAIEEAGKQLIKDKLVDLGKKALGLNEKQTKSLEEMAKDAENEFKKLSFESKTQKLKETLKAEADQKKAEEKERKADEEFWRKEYAKWAKQEKERNKAMKG